MDEWIEALKVLYQSMFGGSEGPREPPALPTAQATIHPDRPPGLAPQGLAAALQTVVPVGVDTALNRRIYEAVTPYAYATTNIGTIVDNVNPHESQNRVERVVRAIRGQPNTQRLMAEPEREDAWLTYLGLPQKNGTLIPSRFQPTRGRGDGIRSYRVRDPLLLLEGGITSGETQEYYRERQRSKVQWLVEELTKVRPNWPEFRRGRRPTVQEPDVGYDIMGTFSWSHGEDEHGPYLAYYDRWDLDQNPVEGREGKFGRPFEIYDRIYYDPRTFEPRRP